MQREFGVLRRAMGQLALFRGTDRLQWFVAEGDELRLPLNLAGLKGWIEALPEGRGFAALTGSGGLTLAGHGFTMLLEGVPNVEAVAGGWAEDHFIPDGGPFPVERVEGIVRVRMTGPAVVRVRC